MNISELLFNYGLHKPIKLWKMHLVHWPAKSRYSKTPYNRIPRGAENSYGFCHLAQYTQKQGRPECCDVGNQLGEMLHYNPDHEHGNRGSEAARLQREYLKQFFMDTEAVPFHVSMNFKKIDIVHIKRWLKT